MDETEHEVKPVAYWVNRKSFHIGGALPAQNWEPLYDQSAIDAARRQGFEEAKERARAVLLSMLGDAISRMYDYGDGREDGIQESIAAVTAIQSTGE